MHRPSGFRIFLGVILVLILFLLFNSRHGLRLADHALDSFTCSMRLDSLIAKIDLYVVKHPKGHLPDNLESLGGYGCPVSGGPTLFYQKDETRGYRLGCRGEHWSADGFPSGYPYFEKGSGWVLGEGRFTTSPPHEYVPLYGHPHR